MSASVANHSNVIALVAYDLGALYNGISLHSSSAAYLSVSGTSLTGGHDNAKICINGVCLTQGAEWFVNDSAAGTAVNIAAGINRDPRLNQVGAAMPISTTVYLRSKTYPGSLPLTSSSSTALTPFAATMYGGTAGNVNTFSCDLGQVSALPTSNYPAGCHAYLVGTGDYLSTEVVASASSWAAVPAGNIDTSKITGGPFAAAMVPSLDTSKIGTGAFSKARIGSGAIDTTKLSGFGSTPDTGKILCMHDDGSIGYCSAIVETGKTCTCN